MRCQKPTTPGQEISPSGQDHKRDPDLHDCDRDVPEFAIAKIPAIEVTGSVRLGLRHQMETP
jgi:hypothetical protein